METNLFFHSELNNNGSSYQGLLSNKSGLLDGNVYGIEIPIERSIDIDNHFDFAIAKFLMEDWENSNHYL